MLGGVCYVWVHGVGPNQCLSLSYVHGLGLLTLRCGPQHVKGIGVGILSVVNKMISRFLIQRDMQEIQASLPIT